MHEEIIQKLYVYSDIESIRKVLMVISQPTKYKMKEINKIFREARDDVFIFKDELFIIQNWIYDEYFGRKCC